MTISQKLAFTIVNFPRSCRIDGQFFEWKKKKKGRNLNNGHVYEVKSSIDFFLLGPFMDGAFGINPVFTEP